MCGIVGWWTPGRIDDEVLRMMTGCLHHRGPDRSDVAIDHSVGLGLGHARLSIIDLSETGAQPMRSADGRYSIVYNGELYNFRSLKAQLERDGFAFRGTSDTEIFLAAICRWGVRGAVERANAMFAFGVWDWREKELWLARDRVGEKPLYYGWVGNDLVFASELKAIRAHPRFGGAIETDAVRSYFQLGYIPAPLSIFKSIYKLPAGHIMRVRAQGGILKADPSEAYWRMADVANAAVSNSFSGDHHEAVGELEREITRAIELRMVADVPVGAFLSGGIDSAAIVALMQRASSRPIKTFTVGFAQDEFDEAPFARAVATHLGTDHHELYVPGSDALALVPNLASVYDEPFADSSQIPTILVARYARSQVTVALSGDGGDELFAGYDRHHARHRIWRATRLVPPLARRIAGAVLRAAIQPAASAVGISARRMTALKLAHVLAADDPVTAYHLLGRHDSPGLLKEHASRWALPATSANGSNAAALDIVQRFMLADAVEYLPDDILVKVDRAAMSVSLETRIPFLDPDLIDLVWRLPLHYKYRQQTRKWILREVLYRHVRKELIDRPKRGFSVPLGEWLRGPLLDYTESMLDHAGHHGYLNERAVRALWKQHRNGRADWSTVLWEVLMFQAWYASLK
jgi:asparagine synthase (glutamine-hydrolysing)